MERIVIVGLGLIGGSLGLALKRAKLANTEIIGVDRERDAAVKAGRRGAVDSTDPQVRRAVSKANLVILATPILAMREVMQEIASELPEGCVVTDTGSTKAQVLRWAQELLPATVSFVGGHPLAGKETSGIEHADARLFFGSTYCVVPAPNATKQAVEAIVGMVTLLEATPYFVDAAEHDVMAAAVSHLPLLLSAALMSLAAKSPSWSEMARMASSGFRDATRLASTDPEMGKGILLTNTEGLSHWLDEYITLLLRYRQMLTEGGEALAGELAGAWEARLRWQLDATSPTPNPLLAEIPSVGERMTEFFVGRRLAQLFRREGELTQGSSPVGQEIGEQSPPPAGPGDGERKR